MKKLAVGTPVWFVTPDKIRRTGEVARYRGSDAVVSVDSGTFYMVPPEEIRLPEPERAPRVIRQEGRVVRADIRQLRDPSPMTGDDWSLSLGYSAGFGTPSEDDVLGWMAEEHPGWRVLDCTNGRPGWLKVVASASHSARDHSLIADPGNVAWQMPVDRWKPGNEPGLMTPELGGGSGSGSPGGRFDIGAEAECDEDEDEDDAKTGRLRITAADLRLGHDVDMPTGYGAHGPAVGHQRTASQDDPQRYDIFQYVGSGQGYTQANAPQPGEDWQLWTPWPVDKKFDVTIRRVSDGVKYHGKPGLTHPGAWKFLGPGVSVGPDTGQLLQAPTPAIPSEIPASAPKSEGDQLVDFFGGGGQWKTPEKHSWSARISWYSPPSAADVAAYLQTLSVSDGVGAVEVTGVRDAGSSGTIQILDVDGTYSVGGSQFWNKLTRADERRDAIQNLVYRELTAAASAQGIQGAGLPDSKVVEVSNVRRVARKTAAAYEQMYGPLGSHFDDSVGTGEGEDMSKGSLYRNSGADPEEAQREEDGESIETIGLGLNVARKTDDPARVRVGVDKTTKTYWTEYYPETEDGKGYGELLVKNVKEDDGDKDADFHKTAPPTEERREMVQAMFLDSFDRMPTFKERVACMLIYRRVDEWGAKTARLIKTAQEEEEGEPLTEEELQEAGVGGFGSKFMKGVGDVAKGIGSAVGGAAEKATEFGADVADTLKTTEGAQSGPASAAALVEAARKDPKLQKSLDKLVLKAIQAWAATPGELEQKLTQNVYRDILTPVINHHQRGWSSGDLRRVNKFLSSEQGMDRIQDWDRRQQRRRPGGGGGGGAPSAPARAPEPTTEEIETDFFGAPEPAPVSPPAAPVVAEEPTPEPAAAVEEEVAAVELGHSAQQALTKLKKMAPEQRQEMVVVLEDSIENTSRWHHIPTVLGGLPAGSISPEEGQEIIDQLTADDEPPPSDPEGGAPPPSSDPESKPEDSALGAQELEEDVLREELGMSEPAAPAPAAPSESAIEFQQTIEEGGGEPPADAPVAETPGEYTPAQLDDMFLALPDDVREGIEDQLGALSEEEYDALIVQRYQEQEGEAAAEPSGLPEDLTTSEPDPEDVISEPGFGVEPEPEPTPDPSDDYAWAEELTSEDLPGLGEVEDRPPSLYDDPDYAAASGNRSDLGMRLYKEEEVARDVRKKVRSLEHALSPREMAQTRADYAQQGKPELAETSIQLSKGSLRDAQDQLAAAEETVAATKVLFDEAEVAFEVAQEKANEYVTQEELRATDPLAAQQQEVARLQEAYDQSGDDADAEFALETAQQALADMEDRVEAPADDLPVEEDIEMQRQELEQDELQPEQELREILDAPGAADRQNVPEIQDLAEEIAEAGSQEILEGTDVIPSEVVDQGAAEPATEAPAADELEALEQEVARWQEIVDERTYNPAHQKELEAAQNNLARMRDPDGAPPSEEVQAVELEADDRQMLQKRILYDVAKQSGKPRFTSVERSIRRMMNDYTGEYPTEAQADLFLQEMIDSGTLDRSDDGRYSVPEESASEEQLSVQEPGEPVPAGEAAIPTEPGRKEELPIPELVVDPAPVSQGDTPTDPIADRGKQRDQGSAPFVEEPPGMTSFLESQSQGEGGKWPSEAPMPDPYAQTDYAHAPEGQPVVAPALSVDTDPHTMLPSEAQNIEDQITEAVEQVMSEDDPLVATPPGENVGSETEVGPVKAMRRRAAEVGDRVVLPAGTPYYAHDAQRRKTTHYPNGSEMNIKLTLQDVRAGGAWGMDAGNVFGTGKNYIWIPSTAFNDLITFEEESRRPSRYTWSDLPHKESNMKKESSAFANVWRALKVASLERNGADIVATITWDSDSPVFADTKSTSMRQVLRTYLKGVSSHKEGRIGNLGFITRARFLDFDMDAGMAVMAFRSSVPVPVKPQVITVSDKDL